MFRTIRAPTALDTDKLLSSPHLKKATLFSQLWARAVPHGNPAFLGSPKKLFVYGSHDLRDAVLSVPFPLEDTPFPSSTPSDPLRVVFSLFVAVISFLFRFHVKVKQ